MQKRVSLETSSTLSRHAKSVVLAHLCIGCVGFSLLESWSLADSLYFSIVTLTTVGFGDLAPKSETGKWFTAAYILFGAMMTATCLGALVGAGLPNPRFRASRLGPRQQAAVLAALLTMAGSAWGLFIEEWSLVDSVYWSIATCATVGYGDLVPSPDTRMVGGVLLLVAVGGFAGD